MRPRGKWHLAADSGGCIVSAPNFHKVTQPKEMREVFELCFRVGPPHEATALAVCVWGRGTKPFGSGLLRGTVIKSRVNRDKNEDENNLFCLMTSATTIW